MLTSIVIATYNGMKYIDGLLDSIRLQEEPADEVVIVDDCSSDGTFEFVDNYIKNNNLDNWNIYRNKNNIGWKANFREGFRLSQGDIVFLCDQDDIWMPYKVAEMKAAMEADSNIQLLVSNYSVIDMGRKEKVRVIGLNRDDCSIEKKRLRYSSLSVMRPGCTYCARRDLINFLWEHDNVDAPHDAMLWGYATITDALYLYNRKTIQFRRHVESASTPQNALSVSRQIGDVRFDMEMESFFIEECERRGLTEKKRIIEEQLLFNQKRVYLLENRFFFRMLFFQLTHFMHYPTFRNMLSDDYILLFKRK